MRKIVIVADAGGTKTEWLVGEAGRIAIPVFQTPGINAAVTDAEAIKTSVSMLSEKLVAENLMAPTSDYEIFFYGAGCGTDAAINRMRGIFREVFPDLKSMKIKIRSDLSGAAVALFGNKRGIACILGTGSGSGYYDGKDIEYSVPSLGFILGDEGSGSFMGRMLLNRYFKGGLSRDINRKFRDYLNLSLAEVIEKVYRQPNPNRFLASMMPFIKENEEYEEISELIDSSLKLFFENNVLKYKHSPEELVRFAGGVAMMFSRRLGSIASEYGLEADKFLANPIKSLGDFHISIPDD